MLLLRLTWKMKNMNTDDFSGKNTKPGNTAEGPLLGQSKDTTATSNPISVGATPQNSIISDMWKTRPVRFPRSQGCGWVAGVCEGIAVRYQIDPTLVRIAFAVAAITGTGFSLYLLLWLILPRFSVDRAPVEVLLDSQSGRYRSEQITGWVLIVFLALITGGFFGTLTIASIITLAFAALMAWMLHQRTPLPPQGLIIPKDTIQFRESVDLSNYQPAPGFTSPNASSVPDWDPLLAEAYRISNPTMGYYHEPNMAYIDEPPKKTRKWSGLLLGAVLLVTLTMCTSTAADRFAVEFNNNAGDITTTVLSEEELAANYGTDVGNLSLDLSQLKTVANDHTIEGTADVGDLTVTIPDTIRTVVHCSSDVGDTNCPTGIINPDAKGGLITLNLRANVGDITVKQVTGATSN